jgi:hypothetical protein
MNTNIPATAEGKNTKKKSNSRVRQFVLSGSGILSLAL